MSDIRSTYSPLHKSLHWLMALLIVSMLILGWYMSALAKPPFKFELYGIHKATGILILALVVLRSLSRFFGKQPPLDETAGPAWQRHVAAATHLALYACMFVMPISGWMMSSAGGHPISFYGLFTVPPLVGPNPELGKLAYEVHDWGYKILWGLIALHVGAAVYHHFVKKDGTLKRMLP